jgi:hypothetical protein
MKKNILKISVALSVIALAGCLDDDKYALDPDGTQNVIEFMDPNVPVSPAGAIYPAWGEAFKYATTVHLERTISFSGPNNNNKDIEVTIDVDPVALADYNAQMVNDLHGDTYELMPESYYDFDATTVIIEKGESRVNIGITLHPPQFDLSKSFALPIRITSSSSGVLSQQFSVGIFSLAVKNKYDAFYSTTLTTTGWAAYGISDNMPGLYPGVIGLVTTGPNTNLLANDYRGDNLQPGFTTANAGATAFGNATPIFVFDDTTDELIDINNKTLPNSAGRDFYINPTPPVGHNQFDPTTRSLTADYYMVATGRPDMHIIMEMVFDSER